MAKRHLFFSASLSKILRRPATPPLSASSPPLLLLRSSVRGLHSFSPPSQSPPLSYCLPKSSTLLGVLNFSGKCFCSGTAEKFAGVSSCWNCHAPAGTAPFLVCGSCRSVQPVDHSIDFFRVFSLEKFFDIEDCNLERKYKEWQKKLHPDIVHTKSEKEREYAAEQSARVIDAYRTLKSALLRAMYILRLEGVHVDEEKTVSDPSMLSEIMEIREAVEEADNSQALKGIQSQIEEKLKHWCQSFSHAFQNRNFEDAQISIQRMTYYERVNEEIVKKL